MAFPDGTGAGRLSRWSPVPVLGGYPAGVRYPNRRMLGSLSTFHKSASSITPFCHCLAKTFSMRVAHCTACPHCIQCGAATSPGVLCFACCCLCAPPHHLHNASANCVLVCCTYSTENSCQCGCGWWGSVARTRALQSCTIM